MCLANSLATVASLVWNFLISLARFAALSPAAVTMIVWGAPFFFEADHSFVEFPEYFSRKPGRFSSVRGLFQEVVSFMALAA